MPKQTHSGKVIAENAGLRIIECVLCHHAHLDPLPSGEDVTKLYGGNELYTNPEHSPPDWFQAEREEYSRGLWNARFANDYKLLCNNVHPMKTFGRFVVMDVGCGSGNFVDWGRQYRPDSSFVGIEPSSVAREHCPPGVTATWPHTAYLYDTIRASLVLEHVLNPRQVLLKWQGKLCERGRLLVIVPNEINSLRRRVGNEWWVVPRHVNYFSGASLRRLLLSSGFRVIYETATMPMELFILLGADYRKNPALGRKLHRLRLQFETMFGAKAFGLYHVLYKRFGWGGALRFVAERV